MVTVAESSVRVLLVKGESAARRGIRDVLQSEDYVAAIAASPAAALTELRRDPYDAVLFDLDDFGVDGFVSLIGQLPPTLASRFITLTHANKVEAGVKATRAGAFGYLAQPFAASDLLALMNRALYKSVSPGRRLTDRGQGSGPNVWPGGMVGDSPPMRTLYELLHRVAPSRATVLITGETGTGKELVARAIHELSARAEKPFVPINCSAWPESLLESELFGHMRGSFTGAITNRRGVFEEASGGTLFLDEVSTLSAGIQVKLLRVLQEREIRRLGAERQVAVDFRLIVATNLDLAEEVTAGRFREDLYYRLNVFPLHVPPLRDRAADIPLLIEHFSRRFSKQNSVPARPLAPEALARLTSYDWPGNVRELENLIVRATIMNSGNGHLALPPIGDKPNSNRTTVSRARGEKWSLARLEREYILEVLESCEGKRTAAADILGIDRRTLYRKLKDYGVCDPMSDHDEVEN